MQAIMMNRLVAISILFLLRPTVANAAYLVDTGPGFVQPGGGALFNTTTVNGEFQYLAVGFSLQAQSKITGIQGWIFHSDLTASTVNFVIYGGGGNVPDVTSELFNQVATIPFLGLTPQWSGLTGLNWTLPAGNFWLAFEPRQPSPSLVSNSMPGGAPIPLPSAFYNQLFLNIGYVPTVPGLGVRIEGTVVPEPANFSLLAVAGLLACSYTLKKNVRLGRSARAV